jgi:hypothetical protein
VQGAIVKSQNFLAVWEHCPPKPLAIRYSLPFYQSLIASRHSPPFRLGSSIAIPNSPPTEVGVYKTKPAKAG